jgi:hypothetical protein
MMEKSTHFLHQRKISKFVKELKIEIFTQPLKQVATNEGETYGLNE